MVNNVHNLDLGFSIFFIRLPRITQVGWIWEIIEIKVLVWKLVDHHIDLSF
jgi:hypothetical protein